MHGRVQTHLKQAEEKEEKTTTSQISSGLFSLAKSALNTTANFMLGDLWEASSDDGKGLGKRVAREAKHANENGWFVSALRFGPPLLGPTIHCIHARAAAQLWLNEDKIHGQNPSGVFKKIFGEDVIFAQASSEANHDRWKTLRTPFVSRLFSPTALKNLMDPMHQVVDKYMREIDEQKGQLSNVQSLAERFTMDVIATTQLGFVKFSLEDQVELSALIDKVITKIANPKNSLPGFIVKGIELFDKYMYGEKTLAELMAPGHALFARLIEKNEDVILTTDNWISQVTLRRLLDPNKEKTDDEWTNYLKQKPKEVLDALHSIDVRNDAALFLVVGHETSAKFFQSLVTYLADHPTYLEKVHEEVTKCLKGRSSEQLTKEDMDQLIYLKAVFYEILRLCPPVPTINGQLSEDMILGDIDFVHGKTKKERERDYQSKMETRDRSKDVLLRKGQYYFISTLSIQRDEFVFGNNASQFDPERFLKKDARGDVIYPYVFEEPDPSYFSPFGGATRSCPGQKFAQQEAGLLFLRMAMKYHFALTQEENELKRYQVMTPVFSLRPEHQISLQLTKRELTREVERRLSPTAS